MYPDRKMAKARNTLPLVDSLHIFTFAKRKMYFN